MIKLNKFNVNHIFGLFPPKPPTDERKHWKNEDSKEKIIIYSKIFQN
jgi:hypothetical protein